MSDSIFNFLSDEGFMPHGYCLLWRPDVFWLHVVSDIIIAVSYFSIPAALIYFVRRRKDIVYPWVIYLFGAFIVSCGVTHLFGIWTMWVPDYALQGLVKGFTGLVSVVTALMLWPLMPKLLSTPSRGELRKAYRNLKLEVQERRIAEEALRETNEQLQQALHDDLTGLPSRNLLPGFWQTACARARRDGRKVALLMVDLNGFKTINDNYGHAAGDSALVQVANNLRESVRGSDMIVRHGGDEFVVLLDGIRNLSEAVKAAAKIEQNICKQINIGVEQVYVGASIGIALSDADIPSTGGKQELDAALARADQDMYAAKKSKLRPKQRLDDDDSELAPPAQWAAIKST